MTTGNNIGDNRNENEHEISMIKKRETPAPRNIYGLIEHLNNIRKRPISGRANTGS